MRQRLPLTVVLATTEPWPDLANCLAVLEPQVAEVDGEIIVGDGHGAALDDRHAASSDRLSSIRIPGASVFELRARAAEMARGEIIATTEDHCIVGPNWCAQILEAFRLHPDAMAVAGPVINGSTDHLIDWANFLHTFGSFVPPWNGHQRERCPPNANVAYRRDAFPSGSIPVGWMELELNPGLHRRGLFFVHDAITVTHVQSFGFWKTLQAHFDNGRTTTGLHPVPLSVRQSPWHLFRGTMRGMGGDERLRKTIRVCMPLIFLLSCCHAAGEIAGILAGPGRSPARLR
jgi:hypothetical protein